MFQDGNYDILEFFAPVQGMNTNISPEALPKDFAVFLQNILPTPLGSNQVRYGTKKEQNIKLDANAKILEAFAYRTSEGKSQIILYVQTFVKDTSAQNINVLSPTQLSFTTNVAQNFHEETPIEISYTKEGTRTLTTSIEHKTLEQDTMTVTLADGGLNQGTDGLSINSLSFSQGSIYVYDLSTSTLSDALKTGLSVACVPRSVTFLNTLLICNGVDRVLSWDGANLTEVVDFVKEDSATNFHRIDNTHFSFSLSPQKADIFDITKYQNNNQIQLKINGITTPLEVSDVFQAQNLITVTTSSDLPNFNQQNHPELFYRDWPPCFSFMAVAHNRLWGLGAGPVGIKYRLPDQAMRVYFSYSSNTLTNWFDEKLKIVPFIDLSKTHGEPDNLEAITSLNELTIFLGRSKTQVWKGSEPLGGAIDPTRPVFEFSSSLPIGIVHGNLMIEMANDVYFVSQQGMVSVGTLNVAKQFAATPNEAVNPLIKEHITSIGPSNQAYRACRSFKYDAGGFCGFKIGFNQVLVSLHSTHLYAWSVFSGDFEKAQSFLTSEDAGLYLLVSNQILRYADGGRGDLVYGDNDGTQLIDFVWVPAPPHLSSRRWANKRAEVRMSYPSSFVLNEKNNLYLVISGDLRRTFMTQTPYDFQFKGDELARVPFVNAFDIGGDPNEPDPEALGFRLDEPYVFPKVRMKFLSSSFGLIVAGSTLSGPMLLKKIRLFGIHERRA